MDLSSSFGMLMASKRINIYQLCMSIDNSIENKNSIMLIISLRSLIERLAYYHYFVRQTKNYPIESNTKFDDLQNNFLPKVIRGLYQTSSEIRNMDANINLRTINIEQYQKKEDDAFNRSPLNILTPIKQLDKKINGIWNSYILLSEYLHPNFGDLELAAKKTKIVKNEFDDLQINRSLRAECGLAGLSESIVSQAIDIIDDVCEHYIDTLSGVDKYYADLQSLSRFKVHQIIVENKMVLKKAGIRKGTKCPCLSGKRIMDCTKY